MENKAKEIKVDTALGRNFNHLVDNFIKVKVNGKKISVF